MLSRLLMAEQPTFDLALKQLEAETHNRSIDAALIAEILEKAHTKMRLLKLDPADTTGRELYSVLMSRIEEDNAMLAGSIGGNDANNMEEMIPLILEHVAAIDMPRDCWVLKEEVAEQMLLHKPPKNMLKRLGYSNVKQMLAGKRLAEVYVALRFSEDADWLNEYNRQYKTLKAADFESRQIQVVALHADKWGDIAGHYIEKKLHNITHSKEMGVIVAMPVDSQTSSMTGKGITLKVFALLLHYYNEVRLYSSFFKLMKAKKNFGEIFVNTLIADPSPIEVTKGTYVHWRVIQRYFGKLPDKSHPEMFEPHVHPEDLHWRKAEEILYKIDPRLEFWRDMDYVGLFVNDDQPVTFNMMDIVFSYANGMSFDERYLYHFRESLWNEIFVRYLGQKNLEERVLRRLDNALIAPETIKL